MIWSPRATAELVAIELYLNQRNPTAAVRLVDRILLAVRRLDEFPSIGREGRVAGTPELVIIRTRYVVAYRLSPEGVEILTIRHGARQWPDTL